MEGRARQPPLHQPLFHLVGCVARLHVHVGHAFSVPSCVAASHLDALQHVRQHVEVGVDVDDVQPLLELHRKLVDLGRHRPRQDHPLHALAQSREHLLFQSAHRQHLAGEGYLARQRDQRAHRHMQQRREQRGRHGDAGGRAFLGHGPLGEVHAHLEGGEQLVVRRLRRLALALALVGAEAGLRASRSSR